MASGIFLINDNKELIELSESQFETEDIFQGLLEDYPNLLSGKLINPDDPRRWILVAREIGVSHSEDTGDRWSLDHLFLDQDGIPTLVEVKRGTDSRIRREVVGQMLDYAANAVVYWPIEKLISSFEETCKSNHEDPEQMIQEFYDFEVEAFWSQVKTNLKAGKIRMIFLADHIPSELKRIVEFLNEQMDPAVVLALEIRQYKANGLQTLVPTLYGNTSDAQKRKSTSYSKGEPWTEERIFSELRKNCTGEELQVAEKIFQWAKAKCNQLAFGSGKTMGSMIPVIKNDDLKHFPFAVWTTGSVEIYFQWHAYKKPFDQEDLRLKMANMLNKIDGVSLQESDIYKRPGIKFNTLAQDDNLKKFLSVFDWYKDQVMK